MAANASPTSSTDAGVKSLPPRSGGALSGWLGIVVVVVLLGTAAYTAYSTFSDAMIPNLRAEQRDFICSKTLKHFEHTQQPGESYPVFSPHSHEKTGWPAEKCFWTKDGNAKAEPTYVLLNEYVGKKEPTLCSDCGRLVEAHNPLPPSDKMEAALKGRKPDAAPAANPDAKKP